MSKFEIYILGVSLWNTLTLALITLMVSRLMDRQ